MIAWSLDACLACGSVAGVVVAVPAGHEHGLDGLRAGRDRRRRLDPGRARRQRPGRGETEYVAIHDAARPLLTPELLEDLVAELAADPEADAIIAAAPVTDTVKKVRVEIPSDSDRNRHAHRRRDAGSLRALGRADASGLQDGGAARGARGRAAAATRPPTRRC